MNFNTSTNMAHFYDEDNVEIGKMKLKAEQVKMDAEFNLWKYLVELGGMEGEEECVEDLFDRLNKELGIDEFDKNKKCVEFNEKNNIRSSCLSMKRSIQKPKIPTKMASTEPVYLYDILYTRDLSKKTKTWHDGVMKYHPNLKLAEYHDFEGTLMMKKTMELVKEGSVVEGAGVVIEICALREMKLNSETDKSNPKDYVTDNIEEVLSKSSQSSKDTNTANISYSILYTTDKQKKAKKWLDGRLDYNPTNCLAKFIDEETGSCFYKKVMKEGEIVVGEELNSGMYLIQIDHLMKENETPSQAQTIQPQVKKIKSIVASDRVPLEGRSNEQLLSLLKSKIQQDE